MLIKLIALTLPLSLDSFLICSAIGATRPSRRSRLKLSFTFALFEGGMPLIGLLAGSLLGRGLGSAAEYLAGGILITFGLYSLIFSKKEDKNSKSLASASGLTLVGLGLGISLDSLAIGFSYGLLKIPAILATIVIVVQTLLATELGFTIGKRLPEKLRVYGEFLASAVLVVIGGFIIIEKFVS